MVGGKCKEQRREREILIGYEKEEKREKFERGGRRDRKRVRH